MKNKIFIVIGIVITVLMIIGILLINGIIIPNEIKANEYEVKGVDVSEYQGNIDWKVLSSQGIDFAFIKATEGSSYEDLFFKNNYEQLKKTNLLIGAYHFFSFDSTGQEQAKNYINIVGDVNEDKFLLPIVDFEFYGDKEKKLPDKDKTQKELQELLNRIEEKYKVKPFIYATQKSYDIYLRDKFTDYELWIRNIIRSPKLPEGQEWTFWQYTNREKLEGYKGKEKYIDMNVFNGTRKEFDDYFWNKKQQRKEKLEQEKIKRQEEEDKKTKRISGEITKIEGDVFWIENEKQEIKKITIPDTFEIINGRTEAKMNKKDIKETDDIELSSAKENGENIELVEECRIRVIKNLKGEKLKEELLNNPEINAIIKEIQNNSKSGTIKLVCEIEDYYKEYNNPEIFEITIMVDKKTKIMASTENQLQELEQIKQTGGNIFVTLRKEDKQKGKLVAENIEVMGC